MHRGTHLMLQNVHNPAWFLAIRDGQTTVGQGGQWCEFHVHHHGNGTVTLRSAHAFGGVGFWDNGAPKPAFEVGEGLMHDVTCHHLSRAGHHSHLQVINLGFGAPAFAAPVAAFVPQPGSSSCVIFIRHSP